MSVSSVSVSEQSMAEKSLNQRQIGDHAFKWLTFWAASSIFVLVALTGYELAHNSHLALKKFGWHFLTTSEWDPVNERFGALPFIFGTLVSSAIALIIA